MLSYWAKSCSICLFYIPIIGRFVIPFHRLENCSSEQFITWLIIEGIGGTGLEPKSLGSHSLLQLLLCLWTSRLQSLASRIPWCQRALPGPFLEAQR